ncbi:MAG: GTPase/DUF3482 domain-containing protein [Candidatus Binatia bacterium]
MSSEIPVFAVVGRINKGKSSIVATLVEEDDDGKIRIRHEPGTTKAAHRIHVEVDGRPAFAVVDTPGFQEAPHMLRWLRERETSAASRPQLVADFIAHFSERDEFTDECRLLEPILEGAGILYVVDASNPYRANYEAEMEILQWTGRPRMALINTIGTDDHVEEWQRALGQYFNIVRVFDAHDSGFTERIGLLRAFRELDADAAPAIAEAIAALESDWHERRRGAASEIAALLVEGLTYSERYPLLDEEALQAQTDEALDRLYRALRDRERHERQNVEDIYRHTHIERREADLERPVFDRDLFADTSWNVLGLSTWQLVRAGAIGGAAVGGAVDLTTGGASFLTGSVVGAVLGGASAYLGGRRAAQVRILGQQMGGRVLRVGPIRNHNFPWILLDRALLHYRTLVGRAHARRDVLVLEHGSPEPGGKGMVAALEDAVRRRIGDLFAKLRDSEDAVPDELRVALEDEIDKLLESAIAGQTS